MESTVRASSLSTVHCRYSWTLYCDWSLGIWQINRFFHPNIAEVVFLQVTPRNGNKLDLCFSKLVLSLPLRWPLWRLLPSLLGYLDVKTRRKLSALSCDEKLVEINKIPVIRPQLKSRDSRIPGFSFCLWIPAHICVGIHEHCTAAEILVFGRGTGFPIQTLQRWYMYIQVTPRNGNKLEYIFLSCYLFLVLGSHSKRLLLSYWATLMLTQVESYQFYHVIKN